jgi:hydroxyethylthiazole kinase-like sugar kinase family protein
MFTISSFGYAFVFGAVLSFFISVMCFVIYAGTYSDCRINSDNKSLNATKKFGKIFAVACISSAILSCLIPSQKQMALIFATSYLSQNNELSKELSKTPTLASKYMNTFIESQLKELVEENTKSSK